MLFYMDILPSGADIENQLLKARNQKKYARIIIKCIVLAINQNHLHGIKVEDHVISDKQMFQIHFIYLTFDIVAGNIAVYKM